MTRPWWGGYGDESGYEHRRLERVHSDCDAARCDVDDDHCPHLLDLADAMWDDGYDREMDER